MSYAVPTPKEALYRLRRLWRLIVVATVIPTAIYTFQGAWGVFLLGSDAGRPVAFALFALVVTGAHAVFFPRVHHETMAVSLVLASLVLLAPLAGFSVLGWITLLIVALILLMKLQIVLPMLEAATARRAARFKGSIRSRVTPDRAFAEVPLWPGQENVRFRCGPADHQGIFPVWVQPDPTPMPLEDMMPDDVEEEWDADMDAVLAEMAADDPQTAADWQAAADEPDFWAVNFERGRLSVECMILVPGETGALTEATRTRYTVAPKPSGCRITEEEINPSVPWGQAVMMHLTDFAQDGLVLARDTLERRDTLSLRRAPNASILTLIGGLFIRRQLARMDAE